MADTMGWNSEQYLSFPLTILDVMLFEKYCSNLFVVIATRATPTRSLPACERTRAGAGATTAVCHEINAWLAAQRRCHVAQRLG